MTDNLQADVTYQDYLAETRLQMERDRAAFMGERPLRPGIVSDRELGVGYVLAAYNPEPMYVTAIDGWWAALGLEVAT